MLVSSLSVRFAIWLVVIWRRCRFGFVWNIEKKAEGWRSVSNRASVPAGQLVYTNGELPCSGTGIEWTQQDMDVAMVGSSLASRNFTIDDHELALVDDSGDQFLDIGFR